MKDPQFICFDCGLRHCRQKHSNATHSSHMNTCGICKNYSLCDKPIEWGGLRGDDWKKAAK